MVLHVEVTFLAEILGKIERQKDGVSGT